MTACGAAGSATLMLPRLDRLAVEATGAPDGRFDLVIAGGGLGGVAAALAAAAAGLRVVLTEETDWIGGQLTSQAVPPDEHPWIETIGGTPVVPRAPRRHPRLLPAPLPADRRGARARAI